MSPTLKFAFAALAFSAIAPAALAEKAPAPRSYIVAFDDLDMSATAGGRTLLGRIEKAARKVCGRATGHAPLVQRMAARCRKETVAATVRHLGLDTLTLAWSGERDAAQFAAR